MGRGGFGFPADLVRLAALEKEIVLIGVQDHLEIWSAGQWESYQAEKQAHFDEIAEAAFGDFDG